MGRSKRTLPKRILPSSWPSPLILMETGACMAMSCSSRNMAERILARRKKWGEKRNRERGIVKRLWRGSGLWSNKSSSIEQQDDPKTPAQYEDYKASSTSNLDIHHVTSQILPQKWYQQILLCLRRFRIRYKDSTSIKDWPLLHLSANVSTQNQPSMPCPCENRIVVAAHHI